ncbi:thymidine phosphorylase [uncultured Paracoccus sp.]|uniref:thymidine phosphorylase n=1 Tax=uncultured Paracoccus sp. TaxID=189685 RepID=UPI002632B61B|nr:thymidine phosphorylase [uncultured Paracoccus sp.]
MSDPRPVIAALREGRGLDAASAALVANGLADGSVSDAQAAAFAMAVLLRGAGPGGRARLTQAMRDSGHVMAWDLPGPVVDKHSTGGIGDTVSLILAPALAASGAYVPMISGRGLGHTGGTLDKLEAIPGYRCDVSEAEFRRVVGEVGCAIVSASGEMAPADRRLYAIRDESGTVESLDLITASILSKKLAAGLQGLVMDVKLGSGAFSKTGEQAEALARALVETGGELGCPTVALITDMDQPLANAAGNALELRAAIRALRGEGGRLLDLFLALSEACLKIVGLEPSLARQALDSGAAAERFARMVAALGGPSDLLENPDRHLPSAPVVRPVPAPQAGAVAAIETEALGHAVVALGGGRVQASDRIDPRVGLAELARIGQEVEPGQPLAMVHAADEAAADRAIAAVQAAYHLGTAPAPRPLILKEITPDD